MIAKHTLGPWKAPDGPSPEGVFHVRDGHGHRVVMAHTVEDAQLVAAAPDLYAAAQHAAMEWRLHGQLTDSCRVLESAIAKAEGR